MQRHVVYNVKETRKWQLIGFQSHLRGVLQVDREIQTKRLD